VYEIKSKTVRLEMDNDKDLERYDKILNDPLCSIIRELKEKVQDKAFDEEGRLSHLHERVVLVVTYQEKSLLE